MSLGDIFEAVLKDPFDKILQLFTPEPTQRDYALVPEAYKTAEDFILEENSKTSKQMAQELLDEMLAEEKQIEKCRVCKSEVKTMCFQGTGVCSILCEKEERFEITSAQRHAITAGLQVESGIK